MERTGADPSSESKTRILLACSDCGAEYDGKGTFAIEAFTRTQRPHRCFDCREKQQRFEEHQRSENQVKRLGYERGRWLDQSGIPWYYRAKGFSEFESQGNEVRLAAIQAYAENFPVDRRPEGHRSLLITGRNNGIGKTHLACAVLSTIVQRFAKLDWETIPYRFWTAGQVKRRIQDAQRFSNKENLDQVTKDLASVWLLVLDDVGKERLVGADIAAVYEAYYGIINDRYNAGLPIVITSNLSLSPWEPGGISLEHVIGWAGCSRLREMTGGLEYEIAGPDRR